ncbi:MAG: hypothetical protein ACXADY_05710 [Candidatus Hodarchaeales archaeon]|jgi:hypothetical protein
MANNGNWKEYLLKISIFGHPDELINPLIQKLLLTYPLQATLHNTSSKSENTFIIQLEIENWRITIYLVQPVGQHLTDKMSSCFYTAIAGSIILFSNNNRKSFEAASTFYRQLRKLNGNLPILVSFIEVLDDDVIVNEPEISDHAPNVTYYGIREDDEKAFSKIIENFVSNYFGI